MTRPTMLDEILRLPPDERLQLIEDIWDSLVVSSASLPVPDWHRVELDERLSDPTECATLSWKEVRARLRSRDR